MHSSTKSYIALQNLFKVQYQADLAKFNAFVIDTLSAVGLPADSIPNEELENFVKGSGSVGIVKGSNLRESKQGNEKLREAIGIF